MIRSIVLAGALALAASSTPSQEHVTPDEARAIAAEGYVFGYPLVLMDVSRAKMTAVSSAMGLNAPMNQFCHMQGFPDASFTDVVSPNADTLYSAAWLDLSREPMVLSLPDTNGRYYLMPLLDAWTNVFASPGKRTTGTAKSEIAICGPAWKGSVPGSVKELRAPTDMVWLIGRTQTNGAADFAAVHAVQAGYKLTPLSRWGKSYQPPTNVPVEASADKTTPPVEQVAKLDGVAFFGRLAALMKNNPPAKEDAPLVAQLAKLGVIAGQPFKPGARLVEAIDAGAQQAYAGIEAAALADRGAGWQVNTGLGSYGTDYQKRAVVARVGLGANLDADALYPSARTDSDGQPLDGSHDYVLHFEKGQTPPVDAFWSLTLYNEKQAFADNSLNRYSLGDRDPLKQHADGSIDIYIQNASPGAGEESNWLPAPPGSFNLALRMYWPKDEALKGAYKVPDLKRVR